MLDNVRSRRGGADYDGLRGCSSSGSSFAENSSHHERRCDWAVVVGRRKNPHLVFSPLSKPFVFHIFFGVILRHFYFLGFYLRGKRTVRDDEFTNVGGHVRHKMCGRGPALLLPFSFNFRCLAMPFCACPANFCGNVGRFHFFLPDCLHGLLPAPFLLSYSVFDFCFFIIFRFWAVR